MPEHVVGDTEQFIGEFDDQRTLRIEVSYRQRPELVWRALTDAGEIAQWFMLVPSELRQGAKVMMRSVSRGVDLGARGTVSVFEAPRVLEYEFDEVFDSTLRFELSPDADGCRLAFTQRLAHKVWTHEPDGSDGTLGPEAAPGWQDFFVESLGAFFDGKPQPTAGEVAARKSVRTEQCRALLAARFGKLHPEVTQ